MLASALPDKRLAWEYRRSVGLFAYSLNESLAVRFLFPLDEALRTPSRQPLSDGPVMDLEKQKFILTLLEYPEETAVTEYKSAIAFDSKSDFGAKLIKHILGQANTGGGYIVIGFQEGTNGKLLADTALNEEVARSYETTRLSQSVDSFLSPGQRAELQVHKVDYGGRTHPVISVQGFKGSPYFCGRDFVGTGTKPILREGAIYVRDVAAKTVLVAGPEHWNLIIKTAVSQRQTELLEHLRSLLGQLGISIPSAAPTVNPVVAMNHEWIDSESRAARSKLRDLHASSGLFELSHFPEVTAFMWDQSRLVAAAQRAVARKTGWPIGLVMNRAEFAPKPTSSGIRATIDTGDLFDYWALHKNGSYYFLRILDEDTDSDAQRRGEHRWIYFDTRIWRVAEALLHCSNLYRELELPPETPIAMRIVHSGLKGRLLGVANRMRMMHWNRKSEEDELTWSKTVPLGSIDATLSDLTREATRALFVLFEFWEPTDQIYGEILNEFSNSKI
jgi:hypothetical protein